MNKGHFVKLTVKMRMITTRIINTNVEVCGHFYSPDLG